MAQQREEKPDQAQQQQGAQQQQTGAETAGGGKPNGDVKLDHSENGNREANLRPFFDAMQRIATEIAPQFKPLGMTMRPEILLSVAMQESGGDKDPANSHSFDDGLGLMQITPYKGQLDANLAKILNWDNSKPVEYNVKNSKWRDAETNIRAGATEMLNKAVAVKSLLKTYHAPGVWDEMDDAHKWRAVSYAYNAGQGAAAKALAHGGPNAPMISTFTYKGKTVSHDYTAEMQSREDYIGAHDPFSGGGGGAGAGAAGGATGGATQQGAQPAQPAGGEHNEPAKSNNGPSPIQASVGQGGTNESKDVKAVQRRLSERGIDCGAADGICGQHTVSGIRAFQASFMSDPDGLISPGHATVQHLFLENGKVNTPAPAAVKVKSPTGGAPPAGPAEAPAPGKAPTTKVVANTGELPRVKPDVKLTPAIEAAYRVLAPYLPSSVWLTSGLRSDADQAQIINSYFAERGGPADMKDVEARREWLGKRGFIIARVGSSPHRTGLAFDLSGASLDTIRGAVDHCFAEHPTDFHFKDTILERANNCLHVDLSR